MGAPLINVRKIKQLRPMKDLTKTVGIKQQQSNERVKALGADLVDDNDDNS